MHRPWPHKLMLYIAAPFIIVAWCICHPGAVLARVKKEFEEIGNDD